MKDITFGIATAHDFASVCKASRGRPYAWRARPDRVSHSDLRSTVSAAVGAMLVLAGCTAPGATTRAAYLAEFAPSSAHIVKWERVAKLPVRQRTQAMTLAGINEEVNRVRYVDDPDDVWKSPSQFWREGGDCEDYAIAKAYELRARGRMQSWLTVAAERHGGGLHAALVVEEAGEMMVMDNQQTTLLSWRGFEARYAPIYSLDVRTGAVLRFKE